MLRTVLLMLLLYNAASELTYSTSLQKQQYEKNLNFSIQVDKEDRNLLNSWTVEFQVKRVSVTTKYRMEMMRHKDYSFNTDGNAKWTECVFLQGRQIRKIQKEFYADESECLTTIAAEDEDRLNAVKQVEKESRKWRKGYRYLLNKCSMDHPADEDASTTCLIQYMEKDKYHKVIQRLMVFKREAMGELFLQLNNSIKDLEECLKTQLSFYIDKIRILMVTLNKCYSVTTQSDGTEEK